MANTIILTIPILKVGKQVQRYDVTHLIKITVRKRQRQSQAQSSGAESSGVEEDHIIVFVHLFI